MSILTIVLSLLLAGTVPAGSAVDISNNYWGSGVAPTACSGSPATCSETNWGSGIFVNQINWLATSGQTGNGGVLTDSFNYTTDLGTITCTTGAGDIVSHKGSKVPLSNQVEDSTCGNLYWETLAYSQNSAWQMEYDTAEAYVEKCPYDTPNIIHAFPYITQAVQNLGASPSLKATTLTWLESVLYLNTTFPEYFCACVGAIQGCVPLPFDTTPGATSRSINYGLTILAWLINNNLCDPASLRKEYQQSRGTQYQQWMNDTSAYRLDTTLPALSSLGGLDTILAKHFLYASVPENYVEILSNASAYPNPAGSGTVISFGISQEAYVKIEVFSVLGNLVSSAGFESLFEPGNKAVPISLAELPSGTYFARIETAYGEAQTVKVVKQ